MEIKEVLETCLCVDNLEKAQSFYQDILGLKVYAIEKDRHVFFHLGKQMFLLFNSETTLKKDTEMPPHGTKGPGHVAFAIPYVKLAACIKRVVRGSGKNKSVSETILWEEEKVIPREQLGYVAGQTRIPIEFSIPYDCKQTDFTYHDNQIKWRLESNSEITGVDYSSTFEIPVFRTEESSKEVTEEKLAQSQIEDSSDPVLSGIEIKPAVMGGTEVFFSPARNLGAAIGLTFFFILWTGAIIFMTKMGAPVFFPIIFGLFEFLIGIFLLELWLGTTRVVFQPQVVMVQNGYLGAGRKKRIPYDQISTIQTKRGMQSGKDLYYDLQILRKNGKKVYS